MHQPGLFERHFPLGLSSPYLPRLCRMRLRLRAPFRVPIQRPQKQVLQTYSRKWVGVSANHPASPAIYSNVVFLLFLQCIFCV